MPTECIQDLTVLSFNHLIEILSLVDSSFSSELLVCYIYY